MRKLAYAAALVFILTGAAVAGDYHTGASLICAECHLAHGSQQHGYASDGSGSFVAIGGAAPYHYLLRNEVNALCLTCHDGSSTIIDVYGPSSNGITNGRQGGGLNGPGTAASNYFEADGHTLGSTDVAPGGAWSNATHGLECTDCHQQHGSAGRVSPTGTNAYRNLLSTSGGVAKAAVTYAIGTNVGTFDVFERSASFGGDHYSQNNVDFNEPSATASAYGAYCQGCHTNFHGSSTDANMRVQAGAAGTEWLRHPTADANIGAVGGGHSRLSQYTGQAFRVKVMDPGGLWNGTGTGLTPSCFSCHRGHGTQNAFGLIYPTGTAAIGENGDGTTAKQLCKQCHVQG